ncbi:MAG: RluA family pseudouridine synthase [Eubacteriales bacterium]|nr:RluA family pseudouridine synthase [Eubacteriales bacterium]
MIFTYENDSKERLDSYLTSVMTGMSRSHISGLIKKGKILLNNEQVKAGEKLEYGDVIEVFEEMPEDTEIIPEDIPLDIYYEDDDVIVVNKPKDMVVHPAPGHYTGTLVNALMYHCKDSLSGINGALRPGIVHRIDKDTTGLIIACKNDRAHASISKQLSEHSITRRYIALVYNNIKEDNGTVTGNIGRSDKDRKKMAVVRDTEGRHAVTHYRVLERFGDITMVECALETGRTHQIRVHMSHIGHPLLGDDVYGIKKDKFDGNGQYLHAAVLGFVHPTTGEYIELRAELPEYFKKTVDKLRAAN